MRKQNPSAQKTRAPKSSAACAAVLFVLGLFATSWSASAQETISLGAAGNVAVLGSSTVTNAGPTTVIGNLALSPGVSVTGFPPGTIVGGAIHIGDALATQADADASTAYGQLVAETLTTDLSGENLGGLTLTPGVYHFDTTAQLTGTLILNTEGNPN